MDEESKRVLSQIDLAEAEPAVLKQEGVLRNLLTTGEPTAEAVAQLARLRELVEKFAAQNSDGRPTDNAPTNALT